MMEDLVNADLSFEHEGLIDGEAPAQTNSVKWPFGDGRYYPKMGKEFPGYPQSTLPKNISELWEDSSWMNEGAPSFIHRYLGIHISADYPKIMGPRYIAHQLEYLVDEKTSQGYWGWVGEPIGAQNSFVGQSDDWDELMRMIAEYNVKRGAW